MLDCFYTHLRHCLHPQHMMVMPGRVASCIRSDGTLNIGQCQARNQRLQPVGECSLGSICSDAAGVVLGTACVTLHPLAQCDAV